MKTCPHCKESFIFEKPKQFGAHVVNCKFNPKLKERLENISKSLNGKLKPKTYCDKCNKEISSSNFDRHYSKCDPTKRKSIPIDENWLTVDGKYKCPHCEFITSKNGISTHIFTEHTEEGKKFKLEKYNNSEIKEKMSWSRGLTKETDIRVKEAAENQKKLIASGEIVLYWLGKTLSPDHKSKLSQAQSIVLEDKGINNSNIFQNVKSYKCKNILSKEYNLRGTYELRMAQWLNDKNILWVRKIYLNYFKEGTKKTYTPDFYLPEHDLYLETKGYYPEKDQIKMKLVLEQNKINLRIIFGETIENLGNIKNINELF